MQQTPQNTRHPFSGYPQLLSDAVVAGTDRVEQLHAAIARPSALLSATGTGRTRGITGMVYRNIRRITRITGLAVTAGTQLFAPNQGGDGGQLRAILNGCYGDHLAATGNPLAVPMRLSDHTGEPLSDACLQHGNGRLLIGLHGLCMSATTWHGERSGAVRRLAEASNRTVVLLDYNSGLSIRDNAQQLSQRLESLCSAHPHAFRDLALVGFSMGGLLAQAAAQHAHDNRLNWGRALRHLVMVGSPQQGATLERLGHWLASALQVSPYTATFARLANARSAGITDLRHGLDDDLAPSIPGVEYGFIAATRSAPGTPREHQRSDGLVSVQSALGESGHVTPTRQRVVFNTSHLGMLQNARVTALLARWLR